MSPTMRVYVATNLSCSLWAAGDMLTSSRGCGPADHSSRDGSIAIVTRDSLLVATAGVLSRPFERTVCQRLPLPAVRECTLVSVALVRLSKQLTGTAVKAAATNTRLPGSRSRQASAVYRWTSETT